ncbi:MAG TPA: hypothetical protein VJ233_04260 [Hyphomicrobiaceae bacterium]|nr:hypothetical protein [Hyphomicrobiaceae bacterium]
MESDRPLRRSEQFFEALRVLRVSWFVPLLAFVVLALPAQVRDLYRALAETGNWFQISVTALLFLLAAFLTYRVGRHRAAVHGLDAGDDRRFFAAILRWGPAVCGALLLAAGALGIYLAALELPDLPRGIDSEIDKTLERMDAADQRLNLAAASIVIVALLFLLLPLAEKWWRPSAPQQPRAFAFSTIERIVWYAAALAMVGLAFAPAASIPLSQAFGALPAFLLFLCVLLVALSALQSWSDRLGVPWIMLLLLWGLALAVFDRGEAHRARLVESPGRGEGLIQLQYAFMEWYRERKDKASYQNEPYPVYLIAAEAGGLYAAQFTAKVLARLQDRCPNFAQHVFAISGVSGGSLGASIFSSLAKKHAKNGPWQPCRVGSDVFEKKVDEILKQDFLAPIVSRAFFADLLQRFLPQPLIVSQFSRGRAFEESIVHAWNRVEGKEGNPFASPFLSHWSFDDAGPALLLNTTSVSDGRQMVASPFGPDIDDPGYHIGYLFMQEALSGKDLTLGSAVGLSGRFPWILPAATVGDNRLALVDGAYFEGSGVETLSVIRNALRPYEVKPAGEASFPYITVHVIVIGGAQPPASSIPITMDELTPPLRTMLNTRDRRGYLAHSTMRDWSRMVDCPPVRPETALMASAGDGVGSVIPGLCPARPPLSVRLNYDYFRLPLGWALSDGMRNIIDRHSRGQCAGQTGSTLPTAPEKEVDQNVERARAILIQNSSVASEVADQLWTGKREGQDVIRLPCD